MRRTIIRTITHYSIRKEAQIHLSAHLHTYTHRNEYMRIHRYMYTHTYTRTVTKETLSRTRPRVGITCMSHT